MNSKEKKKNNGVRFADDPAHSPQRTIAKPLQPLTGLLLALLSGLFCSASSIIIDGLGYLHPGQISLYRFFGIFMLSIPDIVQSGRPILLPNNLFVLVFFRSMFAASTAYLDIVSFQLLPIGEAAVILFSVPVFVAVAANLQLKEPFGYFQSVTILMTVAGTVLSSTKLHEASSLVQTNTIGILTSLFSLMCNTGDLVFLRMVSGVHRSVVLFHLGWWALVETAAVTLISRKFGRIQCGDYVSILLLGLLSYLGQLCLTAAVKRTHAGPVAIGRTGAQIVSFFVWQMVRVNGFPDGKSIAGVSLVVLAMVIVLCKTWYETSFVGLRSFRRLKLYFR